MNEQNPTNPTVTPRDFHHHPRDWRQFLYVYPVLSRRSKGVSIGVNLNPDAACNFDCIYCQVDRTIAPSVRTVDLAVLEVELKSMIADVVSGDLFNQPEFANTPPSFRRVNDIAFSGDGEPTTCPVFAESVQLAADLKTSAGLEDVKIVLITDACYLTRPAVEQGLAIMDLANGEIWAKLDAGTEAYYRTVNVPNYPLDHVIANITAAAKVRPVVIQSLFMRIHDEPPSNEELHAFADRLCDIIQAGGRISLVQLYTVARRPAKPYVSALSDAALQDISDIVRDRTGLTTEIYGG